MKATYLSYSPFVFCAKKIAVAAIMMKRVDRFVKLTITRGDMQITLTDPKSKEVRSLVIYIFPAGRQWEWMRLVTK